MGFDEKYPNARSTERRDHWPPNVRSLSIDGADFLGVDDEGVLYWDGQEVATKSRFQLTGLQSALAVVGVLSAAAVAIVEWLRFFGFGAT